MANGIYVNPTQFVEFADEAVVRKDLSRVIASREEAWDYHGLIGLLPDPDPVLMKRGDGAEILDTLMADDQVTSVTQTRKLGTLKKEFKWEAGTKGGEKASPQAKKLRDNLVEDLEGVDLYDLLSEILDAPYFGMAPIEIHWKPEKSRIRLANLRGLPHRWFGFSEENEPKFISRDNPWDGEELPYGKFVLARHFPTYDNPYGLRLLSRCFWPVMFKKGGIRFWVKFIEKYAMPFLLGRYRQGAPAEEQLELLTKLASMVQDAVAAVPEGSSVELLGSGDKKGSSDLYKQFHDAMDASISKVIMGQTLTADVGDKGSYAASKTHENVLEVYRESDQRLVKKTMNQIGAIYAQVNAPGVPAPVFCWFEEEDPQKDIADRDKTLGENGVTFTKSYYVRRYGFQEDDIADVGMRSEAKTPGSQVTDDREGKTANERKGVKTEYSESVSQEDLDDILTEKMATEADREMSVMVEKVRELTMRFGSLEEIRDGLIDLYSDLPAEKLAETISLGMTGADLAGRLEIDSGSG